MFDSCRETSRRISHTPFKHDASPSLINPEGQTILQGFGIPFVPAGNKFPIPILDDSIQFTYTINMSLHTSASIAEVLLNRRVLKEQDWNGEFLSSMEKGIGRWADEEMQGNKLQFLDLSILFTDDVTRFHFDSSSWSPRAFVEESPESIGERYGAFALEASVCDVICIGDKVEELNRLVPGAGYAACRILIQALTEFHVFTPQTCDNLLENVYEDYYDDVRAEGPDADEDEFVTRKQFTREVPKEVYEGEYNSETLIQAKSKTEDPKLLRLLDDVLSLSDLNKEAQEVSYDLNGYRSFSHFSYEEERHTPCLAIFYGEEGGIEHRIFDDERESISQDDHTYLSFLHCFDVSNKYSINQSALALWWVFRIIVLADQVLQGLGSDSERDHRFLQKVNNHQATLEEA